jgi:hypothetical protein
VPKKEEEGGEEEEEEEEEVGARAVKDEFNAMSEGYQAFMVTKTKTNNCDG